MWVRELDHDVTTQLEGLLTGGPDGPEGPGGPGGPGGP